MLDVERSEVRHHIEMALDALQRARDGLDHEEDGGITAFSYSARQLAIAMRQIASASETLIRELDG